MAGPSHGEAADGAAATRPAGGSSEHGVPSAPAPRRRELLRVCGLQTLVVVAGLGVFALVSALLGGVRGAQGPALVVLFGALHVWLARREARRSSSRASAASWPLRAAAAAGLLALGALLAVVPLAWAGRFEGGCAEAARGLASLTVPAILGTLSAVAWEELWFRNPLVQRVRGAGAVSAFACWNGALFAAVHLLNPAFDLLAEGPELVLAGALLTIVCRLGGSVAAPLVLHVAFNLTSAAARASVAPEVAATMDGADVSLRRCGLLAVACVAFAVTLRRREHRGDPSD